jgi:hypothetical protein
MPRKANGSEENAAHDEIAAGLAMTGPPQGAAMPGNKGKPPHMATAPAFDIWLERQIKILFAACDEGPDRDLVELIRREFAKREDKVTE